MKVNASLRLMESGRFEGTCKALSVPLQDGRTFAQVFEDLKDAIQDAFIEQFYGGKDPGHITIEATAMSASVTFSLDRENNHTLFEFGCRPHAKPDEDERVVDVTPPGPPALPESTRQVGWAPSLYGPRYHFYVEDGTAICGSQDPRGGPLEAEKPSAVLFGVGSPACLECCRIIEAGSEDPQVDGWAQGALSSDAWHYYRDGSPVCGADNQAVGEGMLWPPDHAGACSACQNLLVRENYERQGGSMVPYEAESAGPGPADALHDLDPDEDDPNQMVVLAVEEPPGDPDDGREGWAPEALYPAPSSNNGRWHYYRDGIPVCGDANPRIGDLQTWPPEAGACAACIEVLHREELPPIPGHEEDHPETAVEKATRIRRAIIGWGRRTAGGKLHAIDADGTCLCNRIQGTLPVETDHPEDPSEACRFCRGLTGMDEDEVGEEP